MARDALFAFTVPGSLCNATGRERLHKQALPRFCACRQGANAAAQLTQVVLLVATCSVEPCRRAQRRRVNCSSSGISQILNTILNPVAKSWSPPAGCRLRGRQKSHNATPTAQPRRRGLPCVGLCAPWHRELCRCERSLHERSLHAGACCTERSMPCDELVSSVFAYALIQRLKCVGCLMKRHCDGLDGELQHARNCCCAGPPGKCAPLRCRLTSLASGASNSFRKAQARSQFQEAGGFSIKQASDSHIHMRLAHL